MAGASVTNVSFQYRTQALRMRSKCSYPQSHRSSPFFIFLAMFVVDTFKCVLCMLLGAINVFPHWLPFGTAEDSKLAKVE